MDRMIVIGKFDLIPIIELPLHWHVAMYDNRNSLHLHSLLYENDQGTEMNRWIDEINRWDEEMNIWDEWMNRSIE